MLSQVLRGPEEQEYELKLMTSRTENSRSSSGSACSAPARPRRPWSSRRRPCRARPTRRIADLRDQATLLEKQIQDVKRKVDVGTSPGTEIPKLEVELRRVEPRDRRSDRAARRAARGPRRRARQCGQRPRRRGARLSTRASPWTSARPSSSERRGSRAAAKALIALLTAVPPRGDDRAAGVGSRLRALGSRLRQNLSSYGSRRFLPEP